MGKQKIHKDNYLLIIELVGINNLPQIMRQAYYVIVDLLEGKEDWKKFFEKPEYMELAEEAFARLEEYLDKNEIDYSRYVDDNDEQEVPEIPNKHQVSFKEVTFINRYLKFHNDIVLKNILTVFIEDLQEAIKQKKIRKTSIAAKEIMDIQRDVIRKHNETEYSIHYIIPEKTQRLLRAILVRYDKEEAIRNKVKSVGDKKIIPLQGVKNGDPFDVSTEVQYILLVMDLHGKTHIKETYEELIDNLQTSIRKKQITKDSLFANEIINIQKYLVKYFNKNNFDSPFILPVNYLKYLDDKIIDYRKRNGYDLEELGFQPKKVISLNGIPNPNGEVVLVPSTELAKMKFKTMGFTGKWLDFIGDPTNPFVGMAFGEPKLGKSILCIDFAGYLAKNFGKVLYVASEEAISETLRKKVIELDVLEDNLVCSNGIPADLSPFQFVFIDSINKQGLTIAMIKDILSAYKDKSFIFVLQTIKNGDFRFSKEIEHLVQFIIEVYELGKARQNGRFNQGGEMDIFEDKPKPSVTEITEADSPVSNETSELQSEVDSELSGVKKEIDWTEPEYLSESDHIALKSIKKLVSQKKYSEAMAVARSFDTIVREEIPPEIWLKMGGTLTPSGIEKLERRKRAKRLNFIQIEVNLKFPVKLLAFDILPFEKQNTIHEVLVNEVGWVEEQVKLDLEYEIKEKESTAEIVSVNYIGVETNHIGKELVFFKIKLEGTTDELKKIAGEGKDKFYYKWR